MSTFVRPEQPEKDSTPRLDTFPGIIILDNPVHSLNALSPINETLDGISIAERPVHPEKAPLSIVLTFSGIIIEVSLLQPKNAFFPIVETESPKYTFLRFSLIFDDTL